MKDCPFCDLHQRVIKENKQALLILSNPRKVPGHFLVIPKRHVEKPWELEKSEIADIFELVFLTQKKVAAKLSEGCDVRQNYRPFLKQGRTKVDHVHYHVIPRDFDDAIYQRVEQHETALFEDLTDEEHDSIAAKVMEEEMTPKLEGLVAEAEAELRAGKVSRKFTSADKFLADLKK